MVLHPNVKLFVSFVDNAKMIVVDSKVLFFVPPWACRKGQKAICKWSPSLVPYTRDGDKIRIVHYTMYDSGIGTLCAGVVLL